MNRQVEHEIMLSNDGIWKIDFCALGGLDPETAWNKSYYRLFDMSGSNQRLVAEGTINYADRKLFTFIEHEENLYLLIRETKFGYGIIKLPEIKKFLFDPDKYSGICDDMVWQKVVSYTNKELVIQGEDSGLLLNRTYKFNNPTLLPYPLIKTIEVKHENKD